MSKQAVSTVARSKRVVSRSSIHQAVFHPTRKVLLFETISDTTLSLLAAPFVLWKIPVVGELIHQMRPTGFDEAGGLRLTMSLADMKEKYVREQGQPRGVLTLGTLTLTLTLTPTLTRTLTLKP